jgi:NAD(P)-dependent dehydrogenase (short-subunit alcohol dehydrogenase family)
MKTAFITGATRNIGRHTALKLAGEGFAVAVNGRSEAAVESVVGEIEEKGGTALGCPADVTDERLISGAVALAERELGTIDILVNNAVVRSHGALEDSTNEDWQQVFDVVLMGAVNCTRLVLPGMKSQRWGRIVNMAGVSGQRGAANRAAVVTAKSGLVGLTKATALEVASEGITANAISPGLIDTERQSGLGDEEAAREHYRKEALQIPVGRMGTQEEVACACSYLCSEQAGFITGQVIGVNGGLYL